MTLDDRGEPRSAAPAGLMARARKVLEIVLPAADAAVPPGGSVVLFLRIVIGAETLALREIEVARPGGPPGSPA